MNKYVSLINKYNHIIVPIYKIRNPTLGYDTINKTKNFWKIIEEVGLKCFYHLLLLFSVISDFLWNTVRGTN